MLQKVTLTKVMIFKGTETLCCSGLSWWKMAKIEMKPIRLKNEQKLCKKWTLQTMMLLTKSPIFSMTPMIVIVGMKIISMKSKAMFGLWNV